MRLAAGIILVIVLPGSLITYIWTMDVFWIKFLASSFIVWLVLMAIIYADIKNNNGKVSN